MAERLETHRSAGGLGPKASSRESERDRHAGHGHDHQRTERQVGIAEERLDDQHEHQASKVAGHHQEADRRALTLNAQYRLQKLQLSAFYTMAQNYSDSDSERDATGFEYANSFNGSRPRVLKPGSYLKLDPSTVVDFSFPFTLIAIVAEGSPDPLDESLLPQDVLRGLGHAVLDT